MGTFFSSVQLSVAFRVFTILLFLRKFKVMDLVTYIAVLCKFFFSQCYVYNFFFNALLKFCNFFFTNSPPPPQDQLVHPLIYFSPQLSKLSTANQLTVVLYWSLRSISNNRQTMPGCDLTLIKWVSIGNGVYPQEWTIYLLGNEGIILIG